MRKNLGRYHVTRFIPLIIIFNMFLVFFPSITAIPECPYGVFDAWISIDGHNWFNSTVKNISLSCGQPFYVKTMMKSKLDDIWLALFLFEPGTVNYGGESFEVIEGPCSLNDGCDLGKVSADEIINTTWKLQVYSEPKWVGGTTPLSITGFFQKMVDGTWITEDISFSIAQIYIDNNDWSDGFHSMVKSEYGLFEKNIFYFILPIGCLFVFFTGIFYKRKNK